MGEYKSTWHKLGPDNLEDFQNLVNSGPWLKSTVPGAECYIAMLLLDCAEKGVSSITIRNRETLPTPSALARKDRVYPLPLFQDVIECLKHMAGLTQGNLGEAGRFSFECDIKGLRYTICVSFDHDKEESILLIRLTKTTTLGPCCGAGPSGVSPNK